MNIALGQVVYSKAGRDAGKVFIVTGLIDANYVYISDGSLRRLENPKKKKIKHLTVTNEISDTIAQKISAGLRLTNSDVRKTLLEIKEQVIIKIN